MAWPETEQAWGCLLARLALPLLSGWNRSTLFRAARVTLGRSPNSSTLQYFFFLTYKTEEDNSQPARFSELRKAQMR